MADFKETDLDHHVEHSTRIGNSNFWLLGISCFEHIIFGKCSRQHAPNSIRIQLQWTPEQFNIARESCRLFQSLTILLFLRYFRLGSVL